MANPFLDGMEFSDEESFVSMNSWMLTDDQTQPRTTDMTGASQYSDAPLPQDIIEEGELMNNVAEDTFPPGSRNHHVPLDRNAPESFTIPQPSSSSSFDRAGRTVHSEFADINAFNFQFEQREEHTIDNSVGETPRAVRAQLRAMKSLAQHTGQAYEGDHDTESSISEAVTATSVRNYFKQARHYTTLANPNQNDMELQLFSRIGEAGNAEEQALQTLAEGEKNALSRIVEMMAYTVEFQRHELYKVKSSGIDIFQQSNLEDHNNWSEVDRRRSMTIKSLLQELDNKDRLNKQLEVEMSQSKSVLEKERSMHREYQHKFEKLDSSVRFDKGPEHAYNALHNIIRSHQRTSEAKVAKQRMELDDYARRLMKYEKQLLEMEKQKAEVIQENTKLKVELASHAESDKCHHNLPDTTITCGFENHHHEHTDEIDLASLREENTTLSEQIFELRKELRECSDMKEQAEDRLFAASIDLEEEKRKTQSLGSKLKDAQENERILRDSRDHLRKHSNQIAEELAQNTIDAANEVARKETLVNQLRFELEDRESAIKNYRKHISQLEEQLTKITDETIRRGQSMATDSAENNPGSFEFFERTTTKTTFTQNMQREYNDAKELISEKTETIMDLEKKIANMERTIKLLEEESERWQSATTEALRDYESLKKEDIFDIGGTQSQEFMRRLSMQLNVAEGSSRDILLQLVQRLETLMAERSIQEETKEKLNARIVERETLLHRMKAEYETEISALGVQITQLTHSCERAEKDRLAVEKKLDEIANEEGETMDTQDGTLFDDEGLSFEAAKKAVEELAESKIDLASAHGRLKVKFDDLLGDVKEGGKAVISDEFVREAQEQNDHFLKVIGKQTDLIKKLRRGRRSDNVTRDRLDEDTTTWQEDTTTMDSELHTRTYTTSARKSATSFVRQQLEETRRNLNEKTNDNTKLSTVIKEIEHKMEHVVKEKNNSQGMLKELTTLHEKFVNNLGNMLNVSATTVAIESKVKHYLNMTEVLRIQISETKSLVEHQSTRIYKFSAQKRVLEHIIGIYQRKYHLNVLALPKSTKDDNANKASGTAAKRKLRACMLAVTARNRILHLFAARKSGEKSQEYVDVTKSYSLPGAHRIADGRLSTIPIDNALLAMQSVEKLRKAVTSKNQEINDLRQSLLALDHSLPLPSASTAVPESGNFDYDQDLQKRKNMLSGLLTKALAEKENIEVQLSHERTHRANAEQRAKKYLEKASKLHRKLQTVKLNSDNRERTYKSAIRYFKQKAESAIDVGEYDIENAEPNYGNGSERIGTANSSSTSQVNTSSKQYSSSGEYMSDFVKYLMRKLEKESKELEGLERGTAEHDEKKTTVYGIRATLKNITKTSSRTYESSSHARTMNATATTITTAASTTEDNKNEKKITKNTPMAEV